MCLDILLKNKLSIIEGVDDIIISNMKNMYDLLIRKELKIFSEATFE